MDCEINARDADWILELEFGKERVGVTGLETDRIYGCCYAFSSCSIGDCYVMVYLDIDSGALGLAIENGSDSS